MRRVVRTKALPQDIQEVWFAGDHSDIGGGHTDGDLLAKTAFDWMLGEATDPLPAVARPWRLIQAR